MKKYLEITERRQITVLRSIDTNEVIITKRKQQQQQQQQQQQKNKNKKNINDMED